VPGVAGSIGYELVSHPRFALDLELRAGTGFYREQDVAAHNESIGVGLSWY
jgi:hypothetical protein